MRDGDSSPADLAFSQVEERLPAEPSDMLVAAGADGLPDIDAVIEQRDAYWRSRIEGELQVNRVHIEASFKKKLAAERSALQDQLNDKTSQCEEMEERVRILEEENRQLRAQNGELNSELEAGKAMIAQFSKLMADKASQVCQYCRRSGTLKPISMK
eukprot:gnl/TRDRNA2_/TRDRNA2_36331_c1_seq1.p1 gnl/TRDRNA2_/TRDRNA2_36331_c1~~gnl/TRDRNA2_/TRDRNA2_36331_c1_seq1.p1  ORF type:complete len:182 (+),score=37.83 gnl/TRDRNA2_/TRDRNA2_36331_c1_seq1:77-547(+)